jgi:hypothetical protein
MQCRLALSVLLPGGVLYHCRQHGLVLCRCASHQERAWLVRTLDTGLNCTNAMQAARQAAEQSSAELAIQVDKLTEQAVESAADAQRTLDAAVQKAATVSETTQVRPF